MAYKKLQIYFLSGTGNSYRAACWSAQKAEQLGIESTVTPLSMAKPHDEITDNDETIIGLYLPTHGFTAPWHMIKFAARMPTVKNAHAFLVSTRAGLKLGPLYTPGISASACFILAIILLLKGYSIRGTLALDMPSNWMSLHPGLSPKSVEGIKTRGEPKMKSVAEKIFSGNRHLLTINNLYEIIWTLALTWISVMYLFVARFFFAKLFFANPDCNGCGICAVNCPTKSIIMTGDKNPRPFWKYTCESCMRCMGYCPNTAIEAGHSWGVILYFLTAGSTFTALFIWLASVIPSFPDITSQWYFGLLCIAMLYPALFAAYLIFHQLLKITLINKLFTYTTLTHIYRRYHEPETKLKDIK
jgi:Pyruvate/2-oxoacid:ferredoxin oxidoreductase delta subunit